MAILADDFFDTWCDWKIELYSAISKFSIDPSETTHDEIVKILENQTVSGEVQKIDPSYSRSKYKSYIATCGANRKRDALAIQGPADEHGMMVNTWKCSKHTPAKMRNAWIKRPYRANGNGLYINSSAKFVNEHDLYVIPTDVYEALTQQFKVIK